MISFYGWAKRLSAVQPNAELGRDAVYPALFPVFRAVRAAEQQIRQSRFGALDQAVGNHHHGSSGIWLLYSIRAFAFNLPVLHGYAIDFVRPAEIRHFADYLNDKELIMGNSLIESGTFIAILLGQILGTAVAGVPPYIVGGLVLLVAIGGTMTSLFMPSVAAKMPDTKIEWNIIKGTNSLIREAVADRPVFTSIIGISWFWFVGSVYTTQLPTFTQIHLGGNDNVFNLMLALFSIGIAIGSVLCAKLSHERLILGLVTIGTLGLTVCGLLLVWLTHGQRFTELNGIIWFLSQAQAYPIMLVMSAIGFFGGFFSVPLYTWLQTASSETFRAHAVAANNIINGVFMVSAAILSAVLLMLFDSITLLYLIVAVGNLPLIIYLIKREPKFIGDLTALLKISK